MNVIKTEMIVTDEQIDSWLCGAFEGGSNYWCQGIKVKDNDYKGAKYASDCVSKGGVIIVSGNEKEIDKQTILDTISKMVSLGYPNTFKRLMDGSYDAHDCDVLFQIAVFGREIMG